ncbi:MAG: aspartate--tRNA(Asn) ligase [Patescibacteria group bacterium]|nr:aspartate--tRNA(Asn) ligase [Patescibacteria group bacterium]MBU1877185.1 aspartate--tRNA(Asn) ligase [Patescibacteria group bacterium]
MKRIFNQETINKIGEKIKVAGWINNRRVHGKILFIDLRDMSGIIQVVFNEKNQEPYNAAQELKSEWVVEIIGTIQKRPTGMINSEIKTGEVELQAEDIKILAKSEQLPFDIQELKVSLPTLLDYRPLVVKNQKIKAIFKIEEEIINSFRRTLQKLQFTEFQAPVIVPANAEGGAAVFHIDYYDYDAYLTQSPQLYKQIMLNCFERVFTVNKVFRAEPSVTTRHLAEYTSLDMEMAFIDSWEDTMEVAETVIRNMLSDVKNNCSEELKTLGVVLPQLNDKLPRLKMREAQEIIFKRTKRDNRKEPDLEPEDEKEICLFAKEKYNSELIFITHYPTKKRPFYTYPDPKDPEHTLSFDILCRGLEITTGGQRINDYTKLISNIKKWGSDPRDFEYYLQAFKYGMPPEGGFAMGLERIVKQIIGLENIREANAFPRDMERIDERLSLLQPKKKTAKTKTKKKTKKIKK